MLSPSLTSSPLDGVIEVVVLVELVDPAAKANCAPSESKATRSPRVQVRVLTIMSICSRSTDARSKNGKKGPQWTPAPDVELMDRVPKIAVLRAAKVIRLSRAIALPFSAMSTLIYY